VASLMAQELQWSSEQAKSETAKYVGKINGFMERAGLEPETSSVTSTSRAPAD